MKEISYVAPEMSVLLLTFERSILVDSASQPDSGETPGAEKPWTGGSNWGY